MANHIYFCNIFTHECISSKLGWNEGRKYIRLNSFRLNSFRLNYLVLSKYKVKRYQWFILLMSHDSWSHEKTHRYSQFSYEYISKSSTVKVHFRLDSVYLKFFYISLNINFLVDWICNRTRNIWNILCCI